MLWIGQRGGVSQSWVRGVVGISTPLNLSAMQVVKDFCYSLVDTFAHSLLARRPAVKPRNFFPNQHCNMLPAHFLSWVSRHHSLLSSVGRPLGSNSWSN